MQSIHEIIRDAESNYTNSTTVQGKYVSWSMYDTIERIDAYLNSKHTTGDVDSLGREKPFFNIVTAAVNIWYRATDLDRKDIKFIPTKNSSIILAFVANVILQKWMDKNRFGQFLNKWGRELSKYGSAVVKFVEQDGKLIPMVVPWSRFIADPVSFDAIPRIEKIYYTPAQLRSNTMYDQDIVEGLITAVNTRKTTDGTQKDNLSNFIEVFEIHGQLDERLLQKEPDLNLPKENIKYRQQMHVVSYVRAKDGKTFDDFTLYSGKESKDPYMITHLIEEEGRTLAIGAVEYLFDAQWMQNHTVKNMKDTLDIASKLIFQTADQKYAGRNVLSAIETGDIFVHALNTPLTRVANDKPDIVALQNFGQMWMNMGREITSTPEGTRGITPPSGTALGTVQIVTSQGLSLFEIMTENKGFAIEDMMREYVIPHIKKTLKNKDEILGILDSAGIDEIDAMYIPKAAVKNFNKRTVDQVLEFSENPNASLPQPFNPQIEEQGIVQSMSQMGNRRSFKPDEFGEKTWDEVFSDFEWDNIRVEVTSENIEKGVVLQTLSSVLQTIATNPLVLQDPNAKSIFSAILNETGKISPIQLASSRAMAPPATQPTENPLETLPTK